MDKVVLEALVHRLWATMSLPFACQRAKHQRRLKSITLSDSDKPVPGSDPEKPLKLVDRLRQGVPYERCDPWLAASERCQVLLQ